MTEALAISIGSWLTVLAERYTPQGMVIDDKQFCSTECLKKYIDPLVQQYVDSEDRMLEKMHRSRFDQLQGEPGGPEAEYTPEVTETFEELRARLNGHLGPQGDDHCTCDDLDCKCGGTELDKEAEAFYKDMAPKSELGGRND
jgi:hypothetical protein